MSERTNWSVHYHVRDEGEGGRQWADAVRFGFLSGGWAPVPQRAFRQMQIGDQVWVRLTWKGGRDPGYLARGIVIRQPAPVRDAVIVVDGQDVPFVEAREQMTGFYPASRDEQEAHISPDEEEAWLSKRARLSDAELDEWVVAIRWEGVLPPEERLTHNGIPSPGVQTGYRTKPEHLALLEAGIPRNIDVDDRVEWQDNEFVVTPAAVVKQTTWGRDQDRSEAAEQAAMWLAAVYYDRREWKVKSVHDQDGLGYDLLATKGPARRHIEVKGLTGLLAAPHLEVSQMRCAREDPNWRLLVVTRALDDPEAIELTGPEVLECEPVPARWKVECNGSGRVLLA